MLNVNYLNTKSRHKGFTGARVGLIPDAEGGGRVPALKGRKEQFCQEYVIDYNGTKAAERAGYEGRSSRQQASRLLSQDDVQARIAELQAEQVKRLSITQDYVVLQLLDTYKSCREESPVLKYDPSTGEMEETGMYQFDSKGALRALELLGKHLGMYNPKAAPAARTGNLMDRLTEGTAEDIDTDDLPEVK